MTEITAVCPRCGGSQECPFCGGTGSYPCPGTEYSSPGATVVQPAGEYPPSVLKLSCGECGGTGKCGCALPLDVQSRP
jgi:hypothetical protein